MMLDFKNSVSNYNEPIVLISNQKTIVNYIPVLTTLPVQCVANVQPFRQRDLLLAPIDQRDWSWFRFVVNAPLLLNGGDNILWRTQYYKIMNLKDWNKLGYAKYDCILDFQNVPNTPGTSLDQINGITICDIISHWFANNDSTQPLEPGQIFLYNSNYTLPIPTTFFIVVQLIRIDSRGFSHNIDSTTLNETSIHLTQEVYEINVFSADASAYNVIDTIKLAFNSDYHWNRQKQAGCFLSLINETENSSEVVGGTLIHRYITRINCQSSRKQTSTNPIQNITSVTLNTIFQQG